MLATPENTEKTQLGFLLSVKPEGKPIGSEIEGAKENKRTKERHSMEGASPRKDIGRSLLLLLLFAVYRIASGRDIKPLVNSQRFQSIHSSLSWYLGTPRL